MSTGRVPAWQPTRSVTGNAIHLDDLQISFQRTVRMPDNKTSSKLPPTLGRFDLYNVENFAQTLSPEMAKKGGIFFPMYIREAMWVKFVSQKPYAVQLHVGSINAISGRSYLNFLMVDKIRQGRGPVTPILQDYMIIPEQQWLDGIAVEPGVVRQFVAMTKGSQRSIEFQITGAESFCGIMISVTPHLPNITSRGLFDRKKDMTLRINPLGLPPFEVEASSNDTVDDLKIRIEDRYKEQYPRFRQELLFHGTALEGHRTLEFYGIEDRNKISLLVDLRGGMQIYVKTLSGRTISLECGSSDTIEEIKKKIYLKAGVPPMQQKLVYGSERLEDDKTLSEYNIQPGSLIYLGMGLFGGSGQPHFVNNKLHFDENESMEMSLAAGGRIGQVIVKDKGVHYWDFTKTQHFNVQILNSLAFQKVTGLPAPETPINANLYAELGYPFFEKWDEPTEVAGDFSAVKSLAELDGTDEAPLPEGHRVVTIPSTIQFFRDPNEELLPPFTAREAAETAPAESSRPKQTGPGPWPGAGLRVRMRHNSPRR